MEWYEMTNQDILNSKEDWLQNYSSSMTWEEYWEDNLWWKTEKRNRQRNYKRNTDIVYNTVGGKTKSISMGYKVNTYIPTISLNSGGYLIMEWNE